MKVIRQFISIILLTTAYICIFSATSQAKYRIGVIMTGDIPYYRDMHEAFVANINKSASAVEKFEIILQKPFPDPIALSNAARKLIAFDVDLIVTYGSPAAHAVIDERSSIPLVYAGVYDPERSSLKGKKITGCGYKVPLSSLVRYLKGVNGFEAFRIIFSGVEEESVRQAEELLVLLEQQSLKVKKLDIRTRKDLVQLNTIANDDAVLIVGSSIAHLWLEEILAATRREKVPTADIFPDKDEQGVLITLYQPAREQGESASAMVLDIMKGKRVDTIPPRVFRDTELVFNMNEARKLNISIPVKLVIEATRIIK